MTVTHSRPLAVLAGLLLALGPAQAQAPIYRCGNEYTNNPVNAQARGCRLVEGGNLTIVEGVRPAPAPAGAVADGKSGAAPAKANGARSAAERVDSSEQRARDSDARKILDSELQRAQERAADLREEFNNGQPERLASERSNPQRYQERVADLKDRLERAESDVAAIKREIARLAPAGAR